MYLSVHPSGLSRGWAEGSGLMILPAVIVLTVTVAEWERRVEIVQRYKRDAIR